MNSALVPPRVSPIQYQAIDTVRLIAIASVLWGHSCIAFEHHPFSTTSGMTLQSLMLQLGKAGTILFFLISGFLINSGFSTLSIAGFIKHRLISTILPWILVMIAFGAVILLYAGEIHLPNSGYFC